MRAELGDGEDPRDRLRMYSKERLRAARRVFNDPGQVLAIVGMLGGGGIVTEGREAVSAGRFVGQTSCGIA